MQTLTVELAERRYPIYIGENLLAQSKQTKLLQPHILGQQVFIISNKTIAPYYLATLETACAGYQCDTMLLPDGEQYKNLQILSTIFDALIQKGHRRTTTVIALGGGVVGDISGFAAACYQRGVNFIQIPTTLLAQVDASIGGKTAVNHTLGKNLIGAFYQPNCVIIDTATLKTLPQREYRAGLAEIIKYGMLSDYAFFSWLEQNMAELLALNPEALQYAISRSCAIKAGIVARDERETGERALLNLGHTFAHAIESSTAYQQWLHGEAVASGLYLAAKLSQKLGYISEPTVQRVQSLLQLAGLPTVPPAMPMEKWLEFMARDKKNIDANLRFILLKELGQAFVCDTVNKELLGDILIVEGNT